MVSYTANDGGVAPKDGTDLGKVGLCLGGEDTFNCVWPVEVRIHMYVQAFCALRRKGTNGLQTWVAFSTHQTAY